MATHAGYTIEVPLTCGAAHPTVLYVALAEQGGWDVTVRCDGYVVVHKHCGDWHRVERLRAQIETNRTIQVNNLCQLSGSTAA